MPLKCTGSDPKRVGTLWWCGKPAAVVVTIFGHDVPIAVRRIAAAALAKEAP
jgi:hypothetical protein